MGGWGSGRTGGRPTVEDGLLINLPSMMKRGWVRDCTARSGSLQWSSRGEQFASIGYHYDMTDTSYAHLTLNYTRTPPGEQPEKVVQRIGLTTTYPNFGGRRWWLICPYTGERGTKLYKPAGGDRFAGRAAWRLGYHSQRVAERDKPFEKLFKLQRKLGCDQGWEAGLRRPKGMWDRTYQRYCERYWELDAQCAGEMVSTLARLRARIG